MLHKQKICTHHRKLLLFTQILPQLILLQNYQVTLLQAPQFPDYLIFGMQIENISVDAKCCQLPLTIVLPATHLSNHFLLLTPPDKF